MPHTDPIADMLTRIRNGCRAKKRRVDIPFSRLKAEVARILLEEKFIHEYKILGEGINQIIRVNLKYSRDGEPAIIGIRRVSKPGLREYAGCEELVPVHGGLGIAIVSTSGGILTDHKCKELNVGGEVLAQVW